ncbi:MAG: hypothetical protein Q9162_004904 [Coniocarpon cinnabarinum]
MSFISITASALSAVVSVLSTTWKYSSCFPWFYWVFIYFKTFDAWRFSSVWITWALSSAVLAAVSERSEGFWELLWHGLAGDKLGKDYTTEFASMMLGDQLRQLAIFALLCTMRGKALGSLPPMDSFRNTMDLREVDRIFVTFFLGSTGIQVFLMAFDVDYHGSLDVADVWDTSPIVKVTASVSVKSLLFASGMASMVLAKKGVIKILHLTGYREGPGPSLKGLTMDWYHNNICLNLLVQQAGQTSIAIMEWFVVQHPLTRARNNFRQMKFRYMLKQARRKARRTSIKSAKMITVESEGSTCLVCFEDFAAGFQVPGVSCGHMVHASCWLSILSRGDGKCPHPGCKVRPSMDEILEQSSADDIKESLGLED